MKKMHYVGLLVASLVSQASFAAMTGHPVEATTTLEIAPPPVAFSHVLDADTVLNEGIEYAASTVIARGRVSTSAAQLNGVSLKWNRSVNPEDMANNQPQRALIKGEDGMSPVAVEFTAVQAFTPGDNDNVVFKFNPAPQFEYGIKLGNDKTQIKAGTYKLAVYADISVA